VAGRLKVQPDLSLPGHPGVFVVGDMIALNGSPGVAQVAIQGGRHVAGQLKAALAGKPKDAAFKHDKGAMATVSRFGAVASIGRLRLSGFTAWLMWLVVHLFYLIGFKNRLTTSLHWVVSFLGRGRSKRTVTQQQIFARQALDQLGDRFSPTRSARPE
jgi:NADH:ubiquinone reductase (H+-translocating)